MNHKITHFNFTHHYISLLLFSGHLNLIKRDQMFRDSTNGSIQLKWSRNFADIYRVFGECFVYLRNENLNANFSTVQMLMTWVIRKRLKLETCSKFLCRDFNDLKAFFLAYTGSNWVIKTRKLNSFRSKSKT